MINDGQVFLAGHVASAPAFRQLRNGTSAATVRVAYTPRWLNRETGEWTDGPTSFVSVLCWRTLADNVATSLRKGEPVLVMGRLRVRRYQDSQGTPRTAVEVEANSVGHDLSRGVAHFSRTRRTAGEAAGNGPDAPATGAAVLQEGQDRDGPAGFSLPGGAAEEEAGDLDRPAGEVPAEPESASLDEQAVAELTREMDASLSEVPAPF